MKRVNLVQSVNGVNLTRSPIEMTCCAPQNPFVMTVNISSIKMNRERQLCKDHLILVSTI